MFVKLSKLLWYFNETYAQFTNSPKEELERKRPTFVDSTHEQVTHLEDPFNLVEL